MINVHKLTLTNSANLYMYGYARRVYTYSPGIGRCRWPVRYAARTGKRLPHQGTSDRTRTRQTRKEDWSSGPS